MIRLAGLISLLALVLVGYVHSRSTREQALLAHALQQLTNTLNTENDWAQQRAENLLQQLEDDIAKHRNPPPAMRVLYRAQSLAAQASALRDTLRAASNLLRQAAQHYPVAQPVKANSRRQRALQQQLARYTAGLQQATRATNMAGLVVPAFDGLPLAEARAALAELESAVIDHEARLVQYCARQLPAADFAERQLAAATAEAAVVPPGAIYRARLRLVSYFAIPQVHMYCNNRPVPVSPEGIGCVQFRAADQPGPSVWTASIRVQQQGSRDTTFAVRVPYRVATP